MSSPGIRWISRDDPPDAFPDIETALESPNGLLAAGGDLGPERLLYAYEHAIFPWFEDGQPILWWSPDPRCVLRPEAFHISRRFRRTLKHCGFRVTFNAAFDSVIAACGNSRDNSRDARSGTWITADMIDAYSSLNRLGWAHSVEVWQDGELAGGIYGVAIGDAFFGESMFSRVTNGSRTAVLALCRQLARHRFRILDCQVPSPHLLNLGADLMHRSEFAALIRDICQPRRPFRNWPDGALDAASLAGSAQLQ